MVGRARGRRNPLDQLGELDRFRYNYFKKEPHKIIPHVPFVGYFKLAARNNGGDIRWEGVLPIR